jgi:hypothetical protein
VAEIGRRALFVGAAAAAALAAVPAKAEPHYLIRRPDGPVVVKLSELESLDLFSDEHEYQDEAGQTWVKWKVTDQRGLRTKDGRYFLFRAADLSFVDG